MTNSNESLLNVSVAFRHTDSTDSLKSYAIEKVSQRVTKYLHVPTDIDIVMNIEKLDHNVEIRVLSRGVDLISEATTTNLYTAIDKAAEALDAQLRKHKDKIVKSNRHGTSITMELMEA